MPAPALFLAVTALLATAQARDPAAQVLVDATPLLLGDAPPAPARRTDPLPEPVERRGAGGATVTTLATGGRLVAPSVVGESTTIATRAVEDRDRTTRPAGDAPPR